MKICADTTTIPIVNPGSYWGNALDGVDSNHIEEAIEIIVKNTVSFTKDYIEKSLELARLQNIDPKRACPIVNNAKFISPKEYNYSDDVVAFDIEIDDSILKEIDRFLQDPEVFDDFGDWINENYSSRPGYISFSPSNMYEFHEALYGEQKHANSRWRFSEKDLAIAEFIRYRFHDHFGAQEDTIQEDFLEKCHNDFEQLGYLEEDFEENLI